MPSSTPSTRPSTSIRDGALHDRQRVDVDERVAEPDDAEREQSDGQLATRSPITASGMPNSAIPSPKSAASRPRVARTSATKPPTRPPDSRARRSGSRPRRRPTSRSSNATTHDEHVERAGEEASAPCRGRSPSRRCDRSRRARMPSRSSGEAGPVAGRLRVGRAGAGCAGGRRAAPPTRGTRAALTAKTAATFLSARMMPPSAGPTKVATASSVLEATFAAVSSAGSRARPGRSAACAGRNAAPTTVDRTTTA